MFKYTALITFRSDLPEDGRSALVDRLNEAAAAEPAILRSLLKPTLPGAFGGDAIWYLQFEHEGSYQALRISMGWRNGAAALLAGADVAHVDSAAYPLESLGVAEPGISDGVYRTLFVSMLPQASSAKRLQFEREMIEMPDYISTIRNWGFSRVVEARGARPWTHVWEQEYRDAGGFTGPYMYHPHHWGYIDRWYDHESPDWVIDGSLRHTFCAFDTSMIAP